jgi:hypothetical protein
LALLEPLEILVLKARKVFKVFKVLLVQQEQQEILDQQGQIQLFRVHKDPSAQQVLRVIPDQLEPTLQFQAQLDRKEILDLQAPPALYRQQAQLHTMLEQKQLDLIPHLYS